jgi:hypothetical protein
MKAEPISTGILKLLPISIFFLLGTLVIALLFWLVWLRTKSAPTVSPNDSESDGFARNLMEALAREAAKKLNLAETELSRALWNCRHGKPAGDVLTAPLRVECTLTKSAANRIDACVQMLCQQDGRPVITSLKRVFSWDELPREIRSEFIKTGQPELNYRLCELAQNDQTKSNA